MITFNGTITPVGYGDTPLVVVVLRVVCCEVIISSSTTCSLSFRIDGVKETFAYDSDDVFGACGEVDCCTAVCAIFNGVM